MVGKCTRLQVISQQSTQNTANFPLHVRKTRELFSSFNTGVNFSLRNNFANSGSFAKVSIPVHIYNSLHIRISKLKLIGLVTFCMIFGRTTLNNYMLIYSHSFLIRYNVMLLQRCILIYPSMLPSTALLHVFS